MKKSHGKRLATRSRRLSARKQKTKTRTKRTKRAKRTKRRQDKRRSRRMRGGSGRFSGTLGPVPTYPPGGMYIPGAINGVNGGYYYGDLVNPCLPDPISINNLRGGALTNYLPWGLRNLTRSSMHGVNKFIAAYKGTKAPPGPLPMENPYIERK
jgi:hypothetical protein